jgi:hypothetical protein
MKTQAFDNIQLIGQLNIKMANATPLNRKYLSEFFSQLIAGTKRPFITCIQFPTEVKFLYLLKKNPPP